MKKVLVVLLILAVAGGMFAQDISWSGQVQTGIKTFFGNDDDWASNDMVTGDNNDNDHFLRANVGVTYATDEYGLKVGFRSDSGTAGNPAGYNTYINNGYGWIDFADKLIRFNGGLIDDGSWGAFGSWDNAGLLNGSGARLEIKPMTGLNIGAFFTFPDQPGFKADKVANFLKSSAFGIDYKADAFRFSTALKLYSEEQKEPGVAKDEMDAQWTLGIGYYGLPGFSFVVDGGIKNLMNMSDYGTAGVAQQITYTGIPAVTIYAEVFERFVKSFKLDDNSGVSNWDGKPAFTGIDGTVYAAYTGIDRIRLRFDFSFWANGDIEFTRFRPRARVRYSLGPAWLEAHAGADIYTDKNGNGKSGDNKDAPGKATIRPQLWLISEYNF